MRRDKAKYDTARLSSSFKPLQYVKPSPKACSVGLPAMLKITITLRVTNKSIFVSTKTWEKKLVPEYKWELAQT